MIDNTEQKNLKLIKLAFMSKLKCRDKHSLKHPCNVQKWCKELKLLQSC